MNSDLIKRILILAFVVAVMLCGVLLFTFDIIKINWISFMQIQPSFQPMENPLPVPQDSIPMEGAAYIPGMGAPVNPVSNDAVSIARGAELYRINCSLCHGPQGKGNGRISTFLQNKPSDLTSLGVQSLNDGAIFMVISTGVPGKMPALNENLLVRERWDVVNYVRTLTK
jgi:mono/diheme cytochrome c family protein